MRKIIERLLVFLIGIPSVFALVFLLPHYKHLALNIVVILFSGVGAMEFSEMLGKKGIAISKIEAVILGSLAPLAAAISICFDFPAYYTGIIILAGVMLALITIIFTKKENMEKAANRFAGSVSVIVYPGFFMYWLVKMSGWSAPPTSSFDFNSFAIFLFLLIVFFNDSAAWLFGSLFGKNNRGLIPASPNKSVAGFLGGMAGSAAVSVFAVFLFRLTEPSEITRMILLGFFTGLFASLGDLAESALKRSSDFKDSGNIILGRGGILDSIDSIAAAAPVYYLLYSFFFFNS